MHGTVQKVVNARVNSRVKEYVDDIKKDLNKQIKDQNVAVAHAINQNVELINYGHA